MNRPARLTTFAAIVALLALLNGAQAAELRGEGPSRAEPVSDAATRNDLSALSKRDETASTPIGKPGGYGLLIYTPPNADVPESRRVNPDHVTCPNKEPCGP